MAVPATTLQPKDTFQAFFSVWCQLLKSIHRDIRMYPWRPVEPPQAPCIYNWLLPSPYAVMDVSRGRDTYNMVTYLGVDHSGIETADDMATLAYYVDAFRAKVDPHLWTPGNPGALLGGTVYKAVRLNMQTAAEEVGGVRLLCMAFAMQFDQDRRIREV